MKCKKFWVFVTLILFTSLNGSIYSQIKINEEKSFISNFEFPENRNNPKTGLIDIPVKVIQSPNSKKLDPVFWLSGGPGQTNMDYTPPEELLEEHDFILVGYRGVDSKPSLHCPEISNSLKGRGKDLLSKESVTNIKNSAKKCALRLKNLGIDLDGYTINEVVHDIEKVRVSLGLNKINFLSASYGTRVAQLYSSLFPENVNKSVMVSAVTNGGFVWEPIDIHNKLISYDKLCRNDNYCNGKSNNLIKTFENVLNKMPKNWLMIPIDEGKVRLVTIGLLYNKNTALKVIDAYLAAEKGDYSGIALMSLSYNTIVPKMMNWGDFFSKGLIDYDKSRAYWKEFKESPYILGSPFSSLLMDVGEVWPTTQKRKTTDCMTQIDVQTLILQGELDFSTPHELVGSRLLPNFSNARMVTFENAGHVPDLLYNYSIIVGIKNYYSNGSIDFSKYSSSINFDVNMGFPTIMKGTVAGVVLALVLIILVLRLLNIRIKKRLRMGDLKKAI